MSTRRRTEKKAPTVRNQSLARQPQLESLEARLLLDATIPGMHLADPAINRFDGQVIYLDFDGAKNVTYHGPATVGPFDVPAFKAPAGMAGQEPAIEAQVLKEVQTTFAESGVQFTLVRPVEGSEYSTVYIGGDDSAFKSYGRFNGLAEDVHTGNRNYTDAAFVFSAGLNDPSQMGQVIEHEIGHVLGYGHDAKLPMSTGVLGNVAYAYSSQPAISYAQTWYNRINQPLYNYYPGADCTNFVSQCLIAGGLDLSAAGGRDAWGSIINHEYLKTYLTSIGASSVTQTKAQVLAGDEPGWFLPGDVAILEDNGTGGHCVIAVTGSATQYCGVAAHTYDVWDKKIATYFGPGTTFTHVTYYDVVGGATSDTTPPVITNVQSAPGATSATITWTTNEPATTQVEYDTINTPSHSLFKTDSTLTTSHSITLTGLSPSTVYYYRVWSVDAVGNPSHLPAGTSGSFSLTTQTISDTTPPTPNPSTWATAPYATGTTSISMTVTAASDPSGVWYQFHCITAGGHDSGWRDLTTFTDSGLVPGTTYTYQVRTADNSPAFNIGAYSTAASATTQTAPDTSAPTPNPSTWATAPFATGPNSIAMTATTASDPSGVQYYFIALVTGGHDSGWQDSASYTDTGLAANTNYIYVVGTRDNSSSHNTGASSIPASATTQQVADTTPPTPNPSTWATAPYATGTSSISMTATAGSDPSGVRYYFHCLTSGGHDSGGHDSAWQTSATYQDTGLSPSTSYSYQVRTRDQSANQNTGSYSTALSATTQAASAFPTLSISDPSPILEGNSGSKMLTFLVTMSGPCTEWIDYDFTTASDTATAGSDYDPISGNGSFGPGYTGPIQINVPIYGDTFSEADERFYVNLSNVRGGATIAKGQGVGIILSDDASILDGTAWHDKDGDRAWDSPEPGLPNVTVYLDMNNSGSLDPGEPTQVTGSTGGYSFTDLVPGTYSVRHQLYNNHWTCRSPIGGTQSVILLPGGTVTANFGDAIWADANGDRHVDYLDLGILAANYRKSGKNWSEADFTDDTTVDYLELGILAGNYRYVYVGGGEEDAPAEPLSNAGPDTSHDLLAAAASQAQPAPAQPSPAILQLDRLAPRQAASSLLPPAAQTTAEQTPLRGRARLRAAQSPASGRLVDILAGPGLEVLA